MNTDSSAPVCRNVGRTIMLDININVYDNTKSRQTTNIGSRIKYCRSINNASATSPFDSPPFIVHKRNYLCLGPSSLDKQDGRMVRHLDIWYVSRCSSGRTLLVVLALALALE